MKLVLVERKNKLREQEETSKLQFSMSPINFVKLTTDYNDFKAISHFIQNNEFLEDAKNFSSKEKRKKFIEETLGDFLTIRSRDILLRTINFIKPAEGAESWGAFDEEKAEMCSLLVEINGNIGKVKEHGGRSRALYQHLANKEWINVQATFVNAAITTVSDLPMTFISQFDEINKVYKTDIKPALESKTGEYRTVEGFLTREIGRFPKQEVYDHFKNKTITVAGKPVLLLRATKVTKGLDGKYYMSTQEAGLYKPEVLDINKTGDVNYWVAVNQFKISPQQGPVKIS